MKKFFLGLIAGCLIMASMAVSTIYEPRNGTAEVQLINGLLVFTDSQPVKDFEVLGVVSNGMTLAGSSQYEPVRDRLLKLASKEYPKADGVILEFVNGGKDKATAIRFK